MSRRLTLRGNDGSVFLERFGFETRWLGVFLHRIAGPDPVLDLHDHPWPFVSLILWGGYDEEVAEARRASSHADRAEILDLPGHRAPRGFKRTWRVGTVHRLRLTEAHRITHVRPRTWTLLVRGPKSRPWGFYQPDGWVDYRAYDYATRRPCNAEASR